MQYSYLGTVLQDYFMSLIGSRYVFSFISRNIYYEVVSSMCEKKRSNRFGSHPPCLTTHLLDPPCVTTVIGKNLVVTSVVAT